MNNIERILNSEYVLVRSEINTQEVLKLDNEKNYLNKLIELYDCKEWIRFENVTTTPSNHIRFNFSTHTTNKDYGLVDGFYLLPEEVEQLFIPVTLIPSGLGMEFFEYLTNHPKIECPELGGLGGRMVMLTVNEFLFNMEGVDIHDNWKNIQAKRLINNLQACGIQLKTGEIFFDEKGEPSGGEFLSTKENIAISNSLLELIEKYNPKHLLK